MITVRMKIWQFGRIEDGHKRWLVSPAVPGSYLDAQWLSEIEIIHKTDCTHKGYGGYARIAISEAIGSRHGWGLSDGKRARLPVVKAPIMIDLPQHSHAYPRQRASMHS
jgi:hypothetical protein